MQVVGKRHYGLKAFPAGGGGGRTTTREMFDTLLLWKGRVKLNDNGEAVVALVGLIARREGIGKLLGEGVKRASVRADDPVKAPVLQNDVP